VQCNYGRRTDLVIAGVPLGSELNGGRAVSFSTAVQATEEAVVNALVAGREMVCWRTVVRDDTLGI
jgi:hypothetical protein